MAESKVSTWPVIDPLVGDEVIAAEDTNGDIGQISPAKILDYVAANLPMAMALPVSVIATSNSSDVFPEGITTELSFDTSLIDTLGANDLAGNKLVIPEAGFYVLVGIMVVTDITAGDNDDSHTMAALTVDNNNIGGSSYKVKKNDYLDIPPRASNSLFMLPASGGEEIRLVCTQSKGDNTKDYEALIAAIKVA